MRPFAALALLLTLGACAHMMPGPEAMQTVPGTPAATGEVYSVFFQEWSAGLDSRALKTIQLAADSARLHPRVPILVSGYAADDTGSNAANALLSRTRAQRVVDQLQADGVSLARIHTRAKGATSFALDPVEARRVSIAVGAS